MCNYTFVLSESFPLILSFCHPFLRLRFSSLLIYLFTLSSLTLAALVPYPSLFLLLSHVFVVSHSSSRFLPCFLMVLFHHCPSLLILFFFLLSCLSSVNIYPTLYHWYTSLVLLVLLRLLSFVICLFFFHDYLILFCAYDILLFCSSFIPFFSHTSFISCFSSITLFFVTPLFQVFFYHYFLLWFPFSLVPFPFRLCSSHSLLLTFFSPFIFDTLFFCFFRVFLILHV